MKKNNKNERSELIFKEKKKNPLGTLGDSINQANTGNFRDGSPLTTLVLIILLLTVIAVIYFFKK